MIYYYLLMLDLVKKLDFISEKVFLEIDGYNKIKTAFGAFLSISITVTSIVLMFLFGRDVYERKIPNLAAAEKYYESSKIYFQKNQIILTMYDYFGYTIVDPLKYIDIVIQDQLYKNAEIQYDRPLEGSSAEYCDDDLLSDWYEKLPHDRVSYYTKKEKTYICIKTPDDHYFENDPSSENVFRGTNIYLSYCDSTKRSCPEDTKEVIDNSWIFTNYIFAYIDGMNYEKPINHILMGKAEKVNSDKIKTIKMIFSNNEFISDNGWIIEDKVLQKYSLLQDFKVEEGNRSANNKDMFLTYLFSSPRFGKYIYRSYMKIQDLFAKIGGIINALIILSYFLTHQYTIFEYKANIMKAYIEHKKKLQADLLKSESNILCEKSKASINRVASEEDNVKFTPSIIKNNISRFKNNLNKPSVNPIVSGENKGKVCIEGNEAKDPKENVMSPSIAKAFVYKKLELENAELEKDNFSFCGMIWSYICCNKLEIERYSRMKNRVKNMIDITNIMGVLYS